MMLLPKSGKPKRDRAHMAKVARLVDYDQTTGRVTWKPRPVPEHFSAKQAVGIKTWNARRAGKDIGSITLAGYRSVYIEGCGNVLVHRLAFFIANGWLPDHVDHIDGNRSNNAANNLRPCTPAQNAKNKHRAVNNTTGITGVVRHRGGWQVRLGTKYIGRSVCIGRAIAMRRTALASDPEYTERHGL